MRAGRAMCIMAMLGMPEVCGPVIHSHANYMVDCVRRRGTAQLTKALPSKCRDSVYWRTHVSVHGAHPDIASRNDGLHATNRENVIRAQVVEAPAQYAPRRYVPPAERTYRTDVPRRVCRNGADLNFEARPLSFGYPEDAVAERPFNLSERAWGFFPFVRRFTLTEHVPYRLGEQDEYLTQQFYRRSHFVFTHRRGGWDCWRHLEALAAGTLPYMPDLAQCDRLCLALYPKGLMERVLALPGVSHIGRVEGPHTYAPAPGEGAPTAGPANQSFLVVRPELKPPTHVNPRRVPEVDFGKLDEAAYMALAEEGLAWVRKYQTTKAVVSYMLHEAGYEEPRSVLLVTGDGMDYLEFTVEHGLAALGINYTVVNERRFLRHVTYDPAQGMPSAADMDHQRSGIHHLFQVHGKGIGYGFRLPHTRQISPMNDELKARVAAKEFDLVISSFQDYTIHDVFSIASATLGKERLLLFHGGDSLDGIDTRGMLNHLAKYGTVFQRELEDPGCPTDPPGVASVSLG
jgi:hypothetical protein